jgi:hypothetical protein
MRYISPITKTLDTISLSKIFIRDTLKICLPKYIVSDRDKLYTSNIGNNLHQAIKLS